MAVKLSEVAEAGTPVLFDLLLIYSPLGPVYLAMLAFYSAS
jgi:hypothetical protein